MSMKSCPSCHMDVPAAASRCKHCFHDFTEPPPKRSNGLVGLLALVALMAVIGAGTLWFVQERQATEKIVVDEETHSVIFTKKKASGTETDRVGFDDVAKVELLMGGSEATWEVALITVDGERRTISLSDDTSLKGYAQHVASVMDKPLVEKSEARGFGDLGKTP